jgi:hypothetical protein
MLKNAMGPGVLVLAALLSVAGVLAGTWLAGRHSGIQAERLVQQDLADEQKAHYERALQQERQRGRQAADALRLQLQSQAQRLDDIQRRTAHVPRVVATTGCPDPAGSRLSVAGLLRLNTALGASLPGGASGDAAAPAGAGAPGDDARWWQPTSVTCEQAADNAEINYGRCTEIRARCLALIDFIKQRQSTDPGAHHEQTELAGPR